MSKFPKLEGLTTVSKWALGVPFYLALVIILAVYPLTSGNDNTFFSEMMVGGILYSGGLYLVSSVLSNRLNKTGGREDE